MAQSAARKVVLVIADGIPADVIERLHPPALQSIIDSGKYTRAYVGGQLGTYSQTPTISAPGYNDMLTGTWAYKHNVWDNGNQHPNYHYPTIFRILKTARPSAKTAIFSTWIENRKILLGEGLKETGNLQVDYVFDGFEKDTLLFPHDKHQFYLHQIDDHVVHCADSVIRTNGPDLSWIYLEYTDDIGHARGTGAAFDTAIGLLDVQMKKIIDAIKYRESNFAEDWLLVITTDHGRDSISGNGHGGQSDRERNTWIILNKPVINAHLVETHPGIVDILPSACNFIHLSPGPAIARELDGVPFIGPVSISNPSLEINANTLSIHWKSYAPKEKVKVYISYTNNYASGSPDQYQLLGTSPAGKGTMVCQIPGIGKRSFFKIVVEGQSNCVNVWHAPALVGARH